MRVESIAIEKVHEISIASACASKNGGNRENSPCGRLLRMAPVALELYLTPDQFIIYPQAVYGSGTL